MRKLINIFGGFLLLLLVSCGGGGGYSGEQGPTTKLRMTPVIESISMAAGTYADIAKISQGVKPYYVMITQGGIEPQLLSDGTLRLIAYGPTTEEAEISIQDSSVNQESIKFKATARSVPLSSSIGTTINLQPLESKSTTVTGGIKPYVNAYSLNESIATITAGYNGVYTITGNRPGTVVVRVVDSIGTTLDITVNVTMTNLAVSPASGTAAIAEVINFRVSGGVGAYHVSVVHPAIADAAITGNDLSVTIKAAGTTQLIVTDDLGNQILVGITGKAAAAAALNVTPVSQSVDEGTAATRTFQISGGVAPFTVGRPTPIPPATSLPFNVVETTVDFTIETTASTCVTANEIFPFIVMDNAGTSQTVYFTINDTVPGTCP